MSDLTVWISWLTERYNLEDQAVVARGLSTSDSAVTAQQYHLAPVGNHRTLHVQ